MNKDVMFSSKESIWSTPIDLFNKLNEEFHFDLDPCANKENAKCDMWFGEKEDGLIQDWAGHSVFCNPPYGKKIYSWVEKCYNESKKLNTKVVLLIHARTDTQYFHKFIYHKVKEVRFIKGRLKFGNSKNSAPFPSMIVIF